MFTLLEGTWDVAQIYLNNIIWTLICLFIVRIFIIYLRVHKSKKLVLRARAMTSKIMVVLGSGGHTFEMLRLIKNMNNRYRPRIYVLADTDQMSEKKVKDLEESRLVDTRDDEVGEVYVCEKIPRSREVLQSWLSSLVSTMYACLYSLPVVLRHMPNAILCNGPGTCVPVCIAAFLLHVLGIKHIKVIYVESICRVKTMSLSGKILYHFADEFLVQWPQLKEKYPRAKYLGRLI